jgi:hypothetical protein
MIEEVTTNSNKLVRNSAAIDLEWLLKQSSGPAKVDVYTIYHFEVSYMRLHILLLSVALLSSV